MSSTTILPRLPRTCSPGQTAGQSLPACTPGQNQRRQHYGISAAKVDQHPPSFPPDHSTGCGLPRPATRLPAVQLPVAIAFHTDTNSEEGSHRSTDLCMQSFQLPTPKLCHTCNICCMSFVVSTRIYSPPPVYLQTYKFCYYNVGV